MKYLSHSVGAFLKAVHEVWCLVYSLQMQITRESTKSLFYFKLCLARVQLELKYKYIYIQMYISLATCMTNTEDCVKD